MSREKNLHDAKINHDIHYFRHTYLVVLAWMVIREYLLSSSAITLEELERINMLIAWHDNSKIFPEERNGYAKRFYLNDDSVEAKEEGNLAVKHHKDNNLHHFESLKDYCGEDWKCYVVEMVCDYIAMGWEFKNYLFEYYEENKDKIILPQEYKEYLEYVLKIIKKNCFDIVESPMTYELETQISL